ncbi:MAG: ATP-binding protein [Actinomycetota bacterium]
MPAGADPSLAQLLARLAAVEARVREEVGRRRARDAAPDDRFRGLYISEAQVDELLSGPRPRPAGRTAAATPPPGSRDRAGAGPTRLERLAGAFALDDVDLDLVVVALAPDLDPRFERLYGYLHDDVTRRRASTGLALELCGLGLASAERRRLGEAGALCRGGVLVVGEPERPFPTRSLRVPDRVALHLLGDPTPEPSLAGLVMTTAPLASRASSDLARALAAGTRLAYLRERPGASGHATAAAAFAAAGWPAVVLDLRRLAPGADAAVMAATAVREARLLGAGLVAGPVEGLAERDVAALRTMADVTWPVVLVGGRGWDPGWSADVPLLLDAPAPAPSQRASLWLAALSGAGAEAVDAAAATTHFTLSPDQVWRATVTARLRAEAEGRPLGAGDLGHGALAQNGAGLERLARRVEPEVGWDDLVLPAPVLHQLRELTVRARLGDTVFGDWGLGRGHRGHRSLSALFAGPSGVGKTMAAEVVAGDLGLDMYAIDLATVVDKYIGETEKNLDRIFTEAERVNGVIFFDEADALFGKRSEVKDARDRYANVEVAYLLQRLEAFTGIAVLATNLRNNVDEAFARRLDAVVDFPLPEEPERLRLWEHCLGPLVPRAPDLDLAFMARSFSLSGGNIRNVTVAAAFSAASRREEVTMADLVRATQREYRKLGRLCVEAEFGPWLEVVAP